MVAHDIGEARSTLKKTKPSITMEKSSRGLHTTATRKSNPRAPWAHLSSAVTTKGRIVWRRSQPTALRTDSLCASKSTAHARAHLSADSSGGPLLSKPRRSSSRTCQMNPPQT